MQFYYLDPQRQIHARAVNQSLSHPIVDIDVQWLNLGHKIYPHRLHSMTCFEKLALEIPEDHQFAFRQWYDARTNTTQCIWYSIPKSLLDLLPDNHSQAKSLVFVLQKFFPPSCRNKAVLCFLDLPDCEIVAGYMHGQCVCFKKLPAKMPVNVQHEWMYLQQAYPQWTFDHSVYLTRQHHPIENNLIQTHQQTIELDVSEDILSNRIKLYGLD